MVERNHDSDNESVEDYDHVDAPKSVDNKLYIVVDGVRADDLDAATHDALCETLHGMLRENYSKPPLGVGVVDDITEDIRVAVPHASEATDAYPGLAVWNEDESDQ